MKEAVTPAGDCGPWALTRMTVPTSAGTCGLRAGPPQSDDLHGQRTRRTNRSLQVEAAAAPVDDALEAGAGDFERERGLGENQIQRLLCVVADHGRIIEEAAVGPLAVQNIWHFHPPIPTRNVCRVRRSRTGSCRSA
jgi:hypothetical protein